MRGKRESRRSAGSGRKRAPEPAAILDEKEKDIGMPEEQKTYTLARIVFPDGDFSDQEELFFRKRDFCGDMGDGRIVQGELCSFATWMNLFAAKKWYRYCDLGKLYLRISGAGKCRLDIQGHTLSVIHGVMTETLVSTPCDLGEGGSLLVPVPDPADMEGVSLCLFYEKEGFRFEEASWCTDAPPRRQHKMAVACCTFRRERYVQKNIRKFEHLMEAHPELEGRLHLFVSDNGRTLPAELSGRHVDILPNINAGGAGGFGRGLMAANDGGYTRCIFMDDDVELCPETFLRTLFLTDYLKEEYKDAFVNGAMMSLYDRTLCSESVTVRNGFWLKGYHDHLSVEDLYGTLKCVNVGDDIYEDTFVSSSWWFACFSLDLYRGEYPIPCFIRGDDCEWSWRRLGVHHISINGICVWHTPFEFNTRRLVDHYFLPRNMFMVHSIYNPEFKEEYFIYINGFFRHFMMTYNYVSADLLLSALREILKGWECFTVAPADMMGKLKAICQKADISSCDDVQKLEDVRDIGSGGKEIGKKGIVVDWFPSERAFESKEKVEVYNLITRSCETRRPDKRKQAWQEDEYDMLMLRIRGAYDALAENFREGFPKITGRKFWDGYLGLAEKEGQSTEPSAGEEEAFVEEGMELLLVLEDMICCMDAEKPVAEQIEEAMGEAVRHQMVLTLSNHYSSQKEAFSAGFLHLPVIGIQDAASGMAYLEGLDDIGALLLQWKEDSTSFLRNVAGYQREHGASQKHLDLLRECLEQNAEQCSDFKMHIVVDEEE